MTRPLLKRKRQLAAKIETTPGTAISLAAADAAFNIYDLMVQQEIEKVAREADGSFGGISAISGAYKGKITFKTDWVWDGTSTEPLWAETFFPACGLVKSTNTYAPKAEAISSTSSVKTLTMGFYNDGIYKQLKGCVGTFKIVCTTGKHVIIEWEFSGVWDTPTDVAMLSITYPTDAPCKYASGVTTWDSVDMLCESLTFDVGNEIYMRESAANASGLITGLITDRFPKITANPESRLVATQDRYLQFLNSTEAVLTFEIKGPSTSKIVISAPKAQIQNIQEADRGKMVVDQIDFQLNRNASNLDQEFSIVFTP